VSVSATAAALQTESAAVQSNTTSQQLVSLPASGRAWQTAVALKPGVSQPDYVQSGGSNNPTSAMAITVNGQPPNALREPEYQRLQPAIESGRLDKKPQRLRCNHQYESYREAVRRTGTARRHPPRILAARHFGDVSRSLVTDLRRISTMSGMTRLARDIAGGGAFKRPRAIVRSAKNWEGW
jgi:hypothetical protein